MSESLELISSIILSDDELLVINGGKNEITCGAGCGEGCGKGCGAGCGGCTGVDDDDKPNPENPPFHA